MKSCKLFSTAVILIIATASLAQAANSLDQLKDVKWSFYGDGYYTYNFNNPNYGLNGEADKNQNNYYLYNKTSNSLQLSDVGFTLQKDFHDVAAYLQVDFGPQADFQNGTGNTRNISQAYLSFMPESMGGWRIDAGKFLSHMGFESQYAAQNWNYSRSLSTVYGTPVWNTGARFLAPTSFGRLRPNFYVVNANNTRVAGDDENNNRQLTLGARLDLDLNSNAKLQYNVIAGPQQSREAGNIRVINELNGTLKTTNKLDLAASVVYGSESDPVGPNGATNATSHWQGIALYGHYGYNDRWSFTPRFEIFQDKDNPNTLSTTEDRESVQSFTVTASNRMSQALESRFEIRYDKSDFKDAFPKGSGDTEDNQTTVTAALLWGI